MPSSRRQICATTLTLSAPIANDGGAAEPRATNVRTPGDSWMSGSEPDSSPGVANGATLHVTSPGLPSASRLVAKTWSAGHSLSRRSPGRRRHPARARSCPTPAASVTCAACGLAVDRASVRRSHGHPQLRQVDAGRALDLRLSEFHLPHPSRYRSDTCGPVRSPRRVLPDPPTEFCALRVGASGPGPRTRNSRPATQSQRRSMPG